MGGVIDTRPNMAAGTYAASLAKNPWRAEDTYMSVAELIASEVREMGPRQQAIVLKFLELLKEQSEEGEESAFKDFSLASAMRGMEDEPDIYSEGALRQ